MAGDACMGVYAKCMCIRWEFIHVYRYMVGVHLAKHVYNHLPVVGVCNISMSICLATYRGCKHHLHGDASICKKIYVWVCILYVCAYVHLRVLTVHIYRHCMDSLCNHAYPMLLSVFISELLGGEISPPKFSDSPPKMLRHVVNYTLNTNI